MCACVNDRVIKVKEMKEYVMLETKVFYIRCYHVISSPNTRQFK